MAAYALRPYNAIAQQANPGYAGSMMGRSVVQRLASSPPIPSTGVSVNASGIIRQTPQRSPRSAPQPTPRSAPEPTPRSAPLCSPRAAPQCSPRSQVRSSMVFSARQASPSPIVRQQSAGIIGVSPGVGIMPTLKKSPSEKHVMEMKDVLSDDSTCSPITPQTPSSGDDDMVRGILAQAEAARVRATRALEACKESVPLSKARCRRSNEKFSPRRMRSMPDPTVISPAPKEQWVPFPPMEDLVAGVDLVAAATNSTGQDTPPMKRIAPAFEEPLHPKDKDVHDFLSKDAVTKLKQGSSTPPWPTRLASGKVPEHSPVTCVRPHSYALRDIETELQNLNADLLGSNDIAGHLNTNTKNATSSAFQVNRLCDEAISKVDDLEQKLQERDRVIKASHEYIQRKTSQGMESFEKWRASLLPSASK